MEEPIRKLKIGNCDVIILGTAHISKQSVDTVEKIIQDEKPDTVCVELCETRMKAVKDPEHWKKLDIFKVFKERKMYLLLSNLILSSFQKKLGKGDVKPGDEMRKAIKCGEDAGSKVIPIDREIQTTLKRSWGSVGFFSKMYLLSALIASLLVKEDVSEEKIEEMKSEDVLKDLFSQLPSRYDQIKNVIIDERDIYLAQNIKNSAKDSQKLFAVVGAGHLSGIMEQIGKENDLDVLNKIPPKTLGQKLSWLIFPIILLALLAYTYIKGGETATVEAIWAWILVKGALAALGALIALAHPLSIVLSFVIAPLGNFNPILKPGWVAALVESWLRKPLVEDFERIAEDSEHFTGYWKNRVIRIFLVFMLPQLGSSIGTFIWFKFLNDILA
ncbi:MAG: TraB/GumN family protein [Leptospiraceae bacterium]|nr:TraB/GumN family protein [Leptospiraceae bacterium]MCP5496681.1 TraB/GumN family protein [Leptospiraceae bacterium]